VGAFVTDAARERGHDVRVLSRRAGIDLSELGDVRAWLEGADAVVDVTNSPSLSARTATEFFTTVSTNLATACADLGIRLVTLSIVGARSVPGLGYYRAKTAQESYLMAAPGTNLIVRASQFHEFPAQVIARTRRGRWAVVPSIRVRTVAARSVAEQLVDVATGVPRDGVELIGPEESNLAELARRFVGARGARVRVVPVRPVGRLARQLNSGVLFKSPAAMPIGPTFSEWLDSRDCSTLDL
jgi:uncharacterized protein YbjT (DUF2867 family)